LTNLLVAVALSITLLVNSSWQPWISCFAMLIVLLFWLKLRHGKIE
jgi:hypothetical protein